MKYLPFNQVSKRVLACFWRLQFVLSGFGRVLLAREPGVTHRYLVVGLVADGETTGAFASLTHPTLCFSNDQPNCFTSYRAIPGSLVKYSGKHCGSCRQ